MRISDWSSDVCSSDLGVERASVNLATERASVVFDPEAVSVDVLREAVEHAGYGIREEQQPSVGGDGAGALTPSDALEAERDQELRSLRRKWSVSLVVGAVMMALMYVPFDLDMEVVAPFLLIAAAAVQFLAGGTFYRAAWGGWWVVGGCVRAVRRRRGGGGCGPGGCGGRGAVRGGWHVLSRGLGCGAPRRHQHEHARRRRHLDGVRVQRIRDAVAGTSRAVRVSVPPLLRVRRRDHRPGLEIGRASCWERVCQ